MARRDPIRLIKALAADRSGATLVEFTLILMILLTMTFGIAEFGYAGFQWANAEAATQRGVRLAAARNAAITGIPDCGPGATVSIGQPCSSDSSGGGPDTQATYNWSCTCNAGSLAATCTPAASATCESVPLNWIVEEMQRSYPKLTASNVDVTFSGAGLGFQGLGRPVPIVTVELKDIKFEFIALDGLIGLPNEVNMPAFRASLTAEDLEGTQGT